jgi:hypothetical protein
MSAPYDFDKRDEFDPPVETPITEYNVSKKVVEYSFAAIFMTIGLIGVYNGVEYAGWAIFLAIMIGW